MTDKKICDAASLECARRLVMFIEQGNESAALETLEELSVVREKPLFQELGKLTRDLHNTINDFQLDSKIEAMAERDIPDAKERLNYVITMTEEAADTTLSAVEESLPVSEELQMRASQLQERWDRFRKRDMEVNEFRVLSRDLDEFFTWLSLKAPELQTKLSDILMAQGFQDLTGQIIRRVIILVQEVEESLVDLIRITGQRMQHLQQQQQDEMESQNIAPAGPVVPGVDMGNVVRGQDDVDELLSSLGF